MKTKYGDGVSVKLNDDKKVVSEVVKSVYSANTKLVVSKDDMISVLKQKRSVLLFPEAGYTLDGTATTMPYALAKLVKFLKVNS